MSIGSEDTEPSKGGGFDVEHYTKHIMLLIEYGYKGILFVLDMSK